MYLKSLQMQGFKSFPEKTTLNFEKGITGVVGPNGSGKSNISDAVRWVLGEQSSKSLRGSKMEDVIFDGTKLRKPYGFAQVTLTLENSDRNISSVDADEVTVTRKYFRSGESEYRINGDLVRLKDVHELFMDTGLGRDGYSMVSQGKVADLISDKGSQCREMLEEAAGISAYRYKRTDSLRKLSQADDNLLRLMDILSELEGRVGPLKTQSEKAKKFLEYSDEKKSLEISIWLSLIQKLKQDLKKHEENLLISKARYETVESEIEKLSADIENAISNSQDATAKIESLRIEISQSEADSAELSSQIAVYENSVEHNKSTIERIKAEKEASLRSKTELEKEIRNEESLISQINKLMSEKNEALEKIQNELNKTQEAGESIEEEVKKINELISENNQKISDARVESSTASSLIAELTNRLSVIKAQLDEKNQLYSLQLNQTGETETAFNNCLKKITEQTNIIAGVSMLLESHNKKFEELKTQVESDAFELSSLGSRIRMLEDLEKDMEGYSGAVKAIIKAGEEKKLKGIEGTVSKVISVAEENALAIETALAGAIQNIICRTENDAKRAVEYLKKGNHGRVTFQPISSVKGKLLSEPDVFDCDGFVGIASDLVSCNEDYREIINSLLGRIVVVEDLDYAIKIAKDFSYKFKIVTLDGQVVNAGGSITGGSKSKSAGIISRSLEIKRLSELKEKNVLSLEKQKQKLASLQKKCKSETEDIENKKTELGNLVEERIRLEGAKKLSFEQQTASKDSIDILSAELTDCNNRISAAQKEIKKFDAEIDNLTKEIESNEKKLIELSLQQNKIAGSGDEIAARMSKLRLEIHDCEKDLSARSASLNLLKVRLIEDENKSESLSDEIQKLYSENDNIRAFVAAIKENIKLIEKQKEDKENEIVSIQNKRTETEHNTAELRSLEKDKISEREQLSGELARLEERKNTANEEYDNTVNKLYDEYELSLRQAQLDYPLPENLTESKRRLNELKNKIRNLGSVNVSAIEEYKEVSERYEFMTTQLNDIKKSKSELERLIKDLTEKMSVQFRERFELINKYFGETFKELFNGGSAELVLLDPADVLESEIEIRLQPPGKAIKRLDSLSGGEKGLSAISLLFAILKVNPSPFCIFDEVEAALDDVNVVRYAQYVRKMSLNTQFILITHRRGSMEESDRLYGITMQEQGVSKLLELNINELATQLGIK